MDRVSGWVEHLLLDGEEGRLPPTSLRKCGAFSLSEGGVGGRPSDNGFFHEKKLGRRSGPEGGLQARALQGPPYDRPRAEPEGRGYGVFLKKHLFQKNGAERQRVSRTLKVSVRLSYLEW